MRTGCFNSAVSSSRSRATTLRHVDAPTNTLCSAASADPFRRVTLLGRCQRFSPQHPPNPLMMRTSQRRRPHPNATFRRQRRRQRRSHITTMNSEAGGQRPNPQPVIARSETDPLIQLHLEHHFPPSPATPNGQQNREIRSSSGARILQRSQCWRIRNLRTRCLGALSRSPPSAPALLAGQHPDGATARQPRLEVVPHGL